jgi:hypothetical protein
MNDFIFQIGADNFDTGRIVEDIRKTVENKMRDGAYTDTRVAQAERTNLSNLKNDEEYLRFYLECLRDAVFVDIGDFDIIERRKGMSGFLVPMKKAIWKMLKFYTYRLWSQQNQINGLLLVLLDSLEKSYKKKISDMEKRISQLESCAKTEK